MTAEIIPELVYDETSVIKCETQYGDWLTATTASTNKKLDLFYCVNGIRIYFRRF